MSCCSIQIRNNLGRYKFVYLSPPSITAILKSKYFPNCLANLNVCSANSLVGDMMSALGPFVVALLLLFWLALSSRRWNMGNKKAAVLPLPVLAIATKSLPNNISGIVFFIYEF